MRSAIVLMILMLASLACGRVDRCLDQGGRWNEFVNVCEFHAGPLDTVEVAIAAGRKILTFAYGPQVQQQEPFVAEMDGGLWHVHGSLPEGRLGGVAHAWLDVETGEVRRAIRGP